MSTSTHTESRTRLILVVANETLEGTELHETVQASALGGGRVLVVAPALNTGLRHWLSDSDGARARAQDRLLVCLDALAAAGVEAEGMIADADPLQAALDALAFFSADEIVVATHPEEHSRWLARGLVRRLSERSDLPVLHVVVRAKGVLVERSRPVPSLAASSQSPLVE